MAPAALFMTHTVPLPLVSGERIRNFHLMTELKTRGWAVSLFSLLHSVELTPEDAAHLRELCDDVVVAPIRASKLSLYARLAKAVVTRSALHRHFFFSRAAARRLQAALPLDSFDVIVAETLYMYPYVPVELRGRTVLDTHNVEVKRIDAMARAVPRRPRGLVARRQLAAVAAYEAEAVGQVARVVVVSDEERRALEVIAPGRVDLVPNGVDVESIRPRERAPSEPTLLFVGSMDYGANVDSVEHLVDDVLPHLRRKDANLTLVGSNPGRSLARIAARSPVAVEIAGFVPDTTPYFERSRVFVVALRFGAGTRLKILEALARGVPVVTTTVGCAGLDLVHGRDAVIADEPRELADWIDRLLEDDDLGDRLARQGRRTVESRYDWRSIGAAFYAVLEQATRTRAR